MARERGQVEIDRLYEGRTDRHLVRRRPLRVPRIGRAARAVERQRAGVDAELFAQHRRRRAVELLRGGIGLVGVAHLRDVRVIAHQPADGDLREGAREIDRLGQRLAVGEAAAVEPDVDLHIGAQRHRPRGGDRGILFQPPGRIDQPLDAAGGFGAEPVDEAGEFAFRQRLAEQQIGFGARRHRFEHRAVEDHEAARRQAARDMVDEARRGQRLDDDAERQARGGERRARGGDVAVEPRPIDDEHRMRDSRPAQRRGQIGEIAVVRAALVAFARGEHGRAAHDRQPAADDRRAARPAPFAFRFSHRGKSP